MFLRIQACMKRSHTNIAKLLALGAAGGYLISRIPSKTYVCAGQVAIITGGSRGLGLALARRFAIADVKLVLVARDVAELENALDEMVADGSVRHRDCVLLRSCDLQDPMSAKAVVSATLRKFGRLDILINNAGIIVVGPAENQTVETYREAMEVDFFAALNCIYAVLPQFLQQLSGAIVNIASIGGKFAVPHLLPYVAAKFALTGLSEGLHSELHNKGVRVTTVCPGLMRTGGRDARQILRAGRKREGMVSTCCPYSTFGRARRSSCRQNFPFCR